MATSDTFRVIVLTENDVPGAKFIHPNIDEHSNIQLQRWLECRGLPKNGKRSILLQRVQDCIKAVKDRDITIDVDSGKWYEQKVQESKTSQKDNDLKKSVPFMPLFGWDTFPSTNIPEHFNKGHIHHHIVESVQFIIPDPSVEDSDEDCIQDLHTSKPLRKGKVFFDSGHVQNMKDCEKNSFYFVKAKVMASYRVNVFYDTTVTLSYNSGYVKDAACTCVASAMGRCNHVAALLFAVLDYDEKYGNEKASCTSRKCTCNIGRKHAKRPKKVQDSLNISTKNKKVHDVINFDPRPPSLQSGTEEAKADLLWSIGCHTDNTSMWTTILAYQYKDYTLDDNQLEVLKCQREAMLCNLAVPKGHGAYPVELVQEQHTDQWIRERRVRVTASQCKNIFNANTVVALTSNLKLSMWGNTFSTSATLYGIRNEPLARKCYQDKLCLANPEVKVIKTGMWVNPRYPELACSPDGLVLDATEPSKYGIVEIKCPKILEHKSVSSFRNELKKDQLNRFCLHYNETGTLTLRKNHQYYYQIQMQMAVMNVPWCDFVVWSDVDCVILRIRFDESFWTSIMHKLIEFHHQYICPEYFEMKIPKELPPVKLSE